MSRLFQIVTLVLGYQTPLQLKSRLYLKTQDSVSVLGREEGYTVKYTTSTEGVPEGEAQGNS